MYRRPFFNELLKRLREPRKFIQVLASPRQCGKATLILQVLDAVVFLHIMRRRMRYPGETTYKEEKKGQARIRI